MSEPDAATLDSYQYAIRRLTAETKDLRKQLAAAKAARQREARRLRAERDEGLSPELAVLRRELRHWKRRAEVAEGRLANVRRSVA